MIEVQDGVVDLDQRKVERGGGTARLTGKEASLLAYLAQRADQTVTRADLLAEVWGYNRRVSTRTVDITVRRLRTKIEVDPAEPKHILTIHGEGYAFQPLQRTPTKHGWFPVDPSSFVGRAEELAKLKSLFESGRRIVTIRGPGGQGKTRLARAVVASGLSTIAASRAVFVDLTACRDRTEMLVAAAAAFGIHLDPGAATRDVEHQLQAVVRDSGAVLVVFDNCEQIVDAAADVLAELLATAPSLLVLVTSRERLRIRGEKVFSLGPLSEPEAVALFRERCEDNDVFEQFGDDDLDVLPAIVAQLDYSPLAIELAAAHAIEISLVELEAKLARRFEVLRIERHDVAPRHQSLWAAIDWSWNMLSAAERTTLAQLSVFSGSFDCEAATRVVQLDSSHLQVDEQLWALQSKSLLECRVTAGGERRFALLANIREYAAAQLDASGEVGNSHRRAAQYYSDLAERRCALVPQSTGVSVLQRLKLDVDNILELQRIVAADEPELAARLGLAIQPLLSVWAPRDLQLPVLDLAIESARRAAPSWLAKTLLSRVRAYRVLGRRHDADQDLAELASLALETLDPLFALQLAHQQGVLICEGGDHTRGRELLEQTVAEAQSIHAPGVEADALVDWATAEGRFGDRERAQALLDQALGVYRRLGHRQGEGLTRDVIGWTCLELGQLERAEQHLLAAIEIHREREDPRLEAEALHSLAYLELERGARDRARTLLQQTLLLMQRVGDRVMEAHASGSLGLVALEERDLACARDQFERCSRAANHAGDRRREAGMLACAAAVEALDGQCTEARALLARASSLLTDHVGGWGLDVVAVFEVLTDLCSVRDDQVRGSDFASRARELHEEESLEPGTSLLRRAALRVLAAELDYRLA